MACSKQLALWTFVQVELVLCFHKYFYFYKGPWTSSVTKNVYCQKFLNQLIQLYLHLNSFFKENVRYPIWTSRDPISLILGTRFSLILGTRWWFSLILGTRIGFREHLKKPWFKCCKKHCPENDIMKSHMFEEKLETSFLHTFSQFWEQI